MDVIFKIFLEYGWWGILGIVLCLGLYFTGKYITKRLTKTISSDMAEVGKQLTTEISSQNKELVTTIMQQHDKLINHMINHENDRKINHNTMLGERMLITEDIKNSLRDIGQIHNCQRVFIVEFHNSYQNLSGTPFAKFSCTYEWCDRGFSSVQFAIKDLQFSALSGAISKVYKSNTQQLVYYDIDEFIQDCPALSAAFEAFPCKTMVCTAMYDRDNIMIGALVLEWNYKPDKINLNQLHIQAAELTSMINLRYKYLK